MKVIIDENVPHPLLQHFSHHITTSVQHEGWAGIKNGNLLAALMSLSSRSWRGDE